MKTPPASVLIRKAIGIEKGSGTPNTNKVGKITRKQLEEIAKLKQPDLTAADLDAAVNTIAGSARSMGVEKASSPRKLPDLFWFHIRSWKVSRSPTCSSGSARGTSTSYCRFFGRSQSRSRSCTNGASRTARCISTTSWSSTPPPRSRK